MRDTLAPLATLIGIREGQRFARGTGPRTLKARVAPDPPACAIVKLRLTRIDRGQRARTSAASPSASASTTRALRRARTARGSPSATSADIDYLLPSRLPRGRYVLDVNAIDKAYNRDDARRRGGNRVVFHVG